MKQVIQNVLMSHNQLSPTHHQFISKFYNLTKSKSQSFKKSQSKVHQHLRQKPSIQIMKASSTETKSGTQNKNEWFQKVVRLKQKPRGCHVITREIISNVPEISSYDIGLANFFILHTSASLTINENASPDVPLDLNDSLDKIVPEGNFYRHLDEGSDDMPAHVKSSLMGPSLTIPIRGGRLALGTWQGIYLNEHRNYGGPRSIMVTLQGCLK